jgi:hypothetical protein
VTANRSLVSTIHDAIDGVTTTVEEIHRSVADLPLEALGSITPLKDALDEVRAAQDRSIAAVYELIRTVNARVRRLTTGGGPRR